MDELVKVCRMLTMECEAGAMDRTKKPEKQEQQDKPWLVEQVCRPQRRERYNNSVGGERGGICRHFNVPHQGTDPAMTGDREVINGEEGDARATERKDAARLKFNHWNQTIVLVDQWCRL